MQTRTIYVTANSPGEITGFLVPVVAAIRRQLGDVRVVVILLPCTFATGREEEVARAVPGVDEVLPARSLWRLLLRGLPYPATALVHLGGDLLYAALLARRWKIPTWAFQWANRRWDRYVRGYFVKTAADARRIASQGIAPHKVHVIGDLVVDSVRLALGPSLPVPPPGVPTAPRFVFMPGSRRDEVSLLGPFLLEAAERIRASMPGATFSLLLSPFLDFEGIRPLLEGPVDAMMGGLPGRLLQDGDRLALVSEAGTRLELVREGMLATLAASDFAVTIPGTKTGEAGCLGKPMLMILPSNRMEIIPWHGLLGMLDWLPLVGRKLKHAIYRTMVDKYIWRTFSQPNLLSERPVVPELMGFISPTLVANKVLEIFGQPVAGPPLRGRTDTPNGPYSANGAADATYERMRSDLEALYAPFAGAAERAVATVAAELPKVQVAFLRS